MSERLFDYNVNEIRLEGTIVMAVLCEHESVKKNFYLEMHILKDNPDSDFVKLSQKRIIQSTCNNTNLKLPWKIGDKFYRVVAHGSLAAESYAMLPYELFETNL